MDLVCPAGNLPSLKCAVDNGADAVYMGFRDDTNARHFPGLNFSEKDIRKGLEYAHARDTRVYTAINTYPQAGNWERWRRAVDYAVDLGVDTLIVADMGVLEYASTTYPRMPLHLSVQASATNHAALEFYRERFGIRRAVLPRVLSIKQVENLAARAGVDLEVFGFGGLCIMAEGRCHLSSYVCGQSPNAYGACSPAAYVRWRETPQGLEVRLNEVLLDRFGDGESAGYPTLCKGRFQVRDTVYHALEEPTSLNTLALLPRLHEIGVKAVKIEGRQRSPAYVAAVTRVWREAIDTLGATPFVVRDAWRAALDKLSEGSQTTLGAYHRPWQ